MGFPHNDPEWDTGDGELTDVQVQIERALLTSSLSSDALLLATIQQRPNDNPADLIIRMTTPGNPEFEEFDRRVRLFESYQAFLEGKLKKSDGWDPTVKRHREILEAEFEVDSRMRDALGLVQYEIAPERFLRAAVGLDTIVKRDFETLGGAASADEFATATGAFASWAQLQEELLGSNVTSFMLERADEIIARYETQQLYGDPAAFLEGEILPTIRREFEDSQPIGTANRRHPILEDIFHDIYDSSSFEPRVAASIRDALISYAHDLQLARPDLKTQTAVAEAMRDPDIWRNVATEGIISALKGLPNGSKMANYLVNRPDLDLYEFTRGSGGLGPRELAAAIGAEVPELEELRLGVPAEQPVVIPRAITASMMRLPWALRDLVESEIAGQLQAGDPESFKQRVADIPDLWQFANDAISTVLTGVFGEEVTEIVDGQFNGSMYSFIESLGIPRHEMDINRVVERIRKVVSPVEDDPADVVRRFFTDEFGTLPASIVTQIAAPLQAEVTALAEARGITVDEVLASSAGGSLLDRALEGVLGASFEEAELLAQINGQSVAELLAGLPDAEVLSAQGVLEALREIAPLDVAAGEPDDIAAARGALDKLRQRRETEEAAEDVAADIADEQNRFISENPDLLAQQEELRQRQLTERSIQGFIRDPAAERVAAEVGRNFLGRQRDRIIREISPRIQQDLSQRFTERIERIQQENEATGAQVLGPELSPEEFFNQEIDSVLPDRRSQLGVLRQLQTEDRFVLGGIARRRRDSASRQRGGR